MTKGEQTRQRIIETAAPLFNRRGFTGCSMSEIMEATGLEKGGIYRHFDSKEALALEVLRSSLERSVKLHAPDLERFPTAREKLRFIVDNFVTTPSSLPGGCPLMNAAVEEDDGDSAKRRLVKQAFAQWKQRIAAVVEQGLHSKEFRTAISPQHLANTIVAALEGAQVMSRVERCSEPLKGVQATLHLLIESICH